MKKQAPDVFNVIGDPNRRKILVLLAGNSLTVNGLADNFDMTRPAISKHIKLLNSAGLISIHDHGRERYCSLRRDGFIELAAWVSGFDSFWPANVRKLESLLNDQLNN